MGRRITILVATVSILLVSLWYLVLKPERLRPGKNSDPRETLEYLGETCSRLEELGRIKPVVFTNLFVETNSFVLSRRTNEFIVSHFDALAKSKMKFGVHLTDQWGRDLNVRLLGVRTGDENVVIYDIQVWSNGMDGTNDAGFGDDVTMVRMPIRIVK